MGYHFPNKIVERACTALGVSLNNSGHTVRHPTSQPTSSIKRNTKRARLMSTDNMNPETSQATIDSQATAAIKDLFPKIPSSDLQAIVSRAFEKASANRDTSPDANILQGKERVGTAAELPLQRRVQLAVVAHIRHKYTDYDHLLTQGTWTAARQQVEKPSLEKLAEWRGDHDDEPHAMEDIIREVIVIPDDDEEDEESDDDENPLAASRHADRQGSVEVVLTRNIMENVETRPIDYGRKDNATARVDTPDSDTVQDVQFLGHGQYVLSPNDRSNSHRNHWAGSYSQRIWNQARSRYRKEPTRPTYTHSTPGEFVLLKSPILIPHQATKGSSRQQYQEIRPLAVPTPWVHDKIPTQERSMVAPKPHGGPQREIIEIVPSQVSALYHRSIFYIGPPKSVPVCGPNDSSEPGQVQHEQPHLENSRSRPLEYRPVDKVTLLPVQHIPEDHDYTSTSRRVESGPIYMEESADMRARGKRIQVQDHDSSVLSRHTENVLPSIEDAPRYQEPRNAAMVPRRSEPQFAEVRYLDTQYQSFSRPTMEHAPPDTPNRLKRRFVAESDSNGNDKRIQQYYLPQDSQRPRLVPSGQYRQQMIQLSSGEVQPLFVEKSSTIGHSAVQSHPRAQKGDPVYVFDNSDIVRERPDSPSRYHPALSSPKPLYPVTSSQRFVSEAFPARASASNLVSGPHASPRLDDFPSSRFIAHEPRPHEAALIRRSDIGDTHLHEGSSDMMSHQVRVVERAAERAVAIRPNQRHYEQILQVDAQVRPRRQLPLERSFENLRAIRQVPLDIYREAPISARPQVEALQTRPVVSRLYQDDFRSFHPPLEQSRSNLEPDRPVAYRRSDANHPQDRSFPLDERRYG